MYIYLNKSPISYGRVLFLKDGTENKKNRHVGSCLDQRQICHLPISGGRDVSRFLSRFRLVNFVKSPMVEGKSTSKFSVKINSCSLLHL